MKHRKHPNFLMVGAAKAGTTSIAKYLEEHPEIFISEEKEPFYFVSDLMRELPKGDLMREIIGKKMRADANSYYSMFDNVSLEKRSGEATVHYLFHYKEVIPRVKTELGDISIVIVLRDPSVRAFSNYMFQKRIEMGSFEESLAKEEEKKSQGWNSFWFYKEQGNYFESVKAYLDNFSQVHICFFEDLKKDPNKFMSEMYRFLEVDTGFTPKTNVKHNPTLVPKNKLIKGLYYLKFKYNLKFGLPGFMKRGLMSASVKKGEDKIENGTLKDLRAYYKPNIQKLENLLNKDLSSWYD